MWEYFLIGWTCFVLLVFLHLIFDCLYYYSNLPISVPLKWDELNN